MLLHNLSSTILLLWLRTSQKGNPSTGNFNAVMRLCQNMINRTEIFSSSSIYRLQYLHSAESLVANKCFGRNLRNQILLQTSEKKQKDYSIHTIQHFFGQDKIRNLSSEAKSSQLCLFIWRDTGWMKSHREMLIKSYPHTKMVPTLCRGSENHICETLNWHGLFFLKGSSKNGLSFACIRNATTWNWYG